MEEDTCSPSGHADLGIGAIAKQKVPRPWPHDRATPDGLQPCSGDTGIVAYALAMS